MRPIEDILVDNLRSLEADKDITDSLSNAKEYANLVANEGTFYDSMFSYYQESQMESMFGDKGITLPEDVKKANTRNYNTLENKYLNESTNMAMYEFRKKRVDADRQAMQTLGAYGAGSVITGTLVTSLADPLGYLSGGIIAKVGNSVMAAKKSTGLAVTAMAATSGAINYGLSSFEQSQSSNITDTDVWLNGLLGAAMDGAIAGYMYKGKGAETGMEDITALIDEVNNPRPIVMSPEERAAWQAESEETYKQWDELLQRDAEEAAWVAEQEKLAEAYRKQSDKIARDELQKSNKEWTAQQKAEAKAYREETKAINAKIKSEEDQAYAQVKEEEEWLAAQQKEAEAYHKETEKITGKEWLDQAKAEAKDYKAETKAINNQIKEEEKLAYTQRKEQEAEELEAQRREEEFEASMRAEAEKYHAETEKLRRELDDEAYYAAEAKAAEDYHMATKQLIAEQQAEMFRKFLGMTPIEKAFHEAREGRYWSDSANELGLNWTDHTGNRSAPPSVVKEEVVKTVDEEALEAIQADLAKFDEEDLIAHEEYAKEAEELAPPEPPKPTVEGKEVEAAKTEEKPEPPTEAEIQQKVKEVFDNDNNSKEIQSILKFEKDNSAEARRTARRRDKVAEQTIGTPQANLNAAPSIKSLETILNERPELKNRTFTEEVPEEVIEEADVDPNVGIEPEGEDMLEDMLAEMEAEAAPEPVKEPEPEPIPEPEPVKPKSSLAERKEAVVGKFVREAQDSKQFIKDTKEYSSVRNLVDDDFEKLFKEDLLFYPLKDGNWSVIVYDDKRLAQQVKKTLGLRSFTTANATELRKVFNDALANINPKPIPKLSNTPSKSWDDIMKESDDEFKF